MVTASLRKPISFCLLLLLLAPGAVSQTSVSAETPRGVIRLRVRVAQGNKARGLPRKRFFLIKGSLADHKAFVDQLERQPIVTRDCYYRNQGASPALIDWLAENDCESVYCREIELKNVEGIQAVPEFQRAVAAGEKEFGNRELARKWLTVNLANELRSGFYKARQQRLTRFISQIENVGQTRVASVMTDRNGTAYFTDIEPGIYIISNLLPIEIGNNSSLWNCQVTIKAGDLATERPFLISNPGNKDPRDAKNIKCVSVEKPLPVCESRVR